MRCAIRSLVSALRRLDGKSVGVSGQQAACARLGIWAAVRPTIQDHTSRQLVLSALPAHHYFTDPILCTYQCLKRRK